MTSAGLDAGDDVWLTELAPALRRAVELDRAALVRLRVSDERATALVHLPFGVLVARTVTYSAAGDRGERDMTFAAVDTLAWLDGGRDVAPIRRDADWRGGLPPARGWQRLETVPDDVVRPLVRRGAQALKDAAVREGVPGAQPRAEVADALLDSVVLSADDDAGHRAGVTLRTLSALVRMGFLARGGPAHIDLSGRWIRVVGAYGTVYLERPGAGLGVVAR